MNGGEEQGAGRSMLGGTLWVVVASLPWLVPTHMDPWTTFYNDTMAAAVLLPLVVLLFFSSAQGWIVTRAALFAICLSAVPLVQAVTGILLIPEESFVIVGFILAFAVALSLGQQRQLIESHRIADGLFASFILASILSTGLSLYQWLALDGLGVLVLSPAIGGVRAVALVGQPNNLATLLVWGCIGVWWAYNRRFVGSGCAVLAVAFFLVGVALTGSRTGCLQVAFLAGVALIFWWPRNTRNRLIAVLLLASWFVTLLLLLPLLSNFLFGATSREMLSVGIRPIFWSMALDGIVDRPLVGYGWNQVVTVHVEFAEKYSGVGSVMGHAHNLFLDLLLWNGVVVGAVLIAAIVWWGVVQVLKVKTESHGIILAAIGVFLLHSMLELPHLYLIFLVPVGLLVGMASSFLPMKIIATLPRFSIIVIGVVMAAALVIVFRDYRLIEDSLAARKFVAARISGAVSPSSPDVILLKSLQGALERLDAVPSRNMPAAALEERHLTVLRYPTTGGLFRYAQSAALNNRADEAAWALQLICYLRPKQTCKSVIDDWRTLASSGNPEMNSVVMPRVE
ncbi:Wzy polymerase domain-containing protein [Pseudomonas sp. 30_B]|uniref:PglL family O-oligosaccharyltransferase n=1 Tax=Pseudomonas sp. 30_B TaxID=2813575 RepID=UPI0034D2E228